MKCYNTAMQGMSGKLGPMIFYQLHGKTFVKLAPVKRKKQCTPAQKTMQTKFLDAAKFAKVMTSNPELKAMYEYMSQGRHTAFSEAIAEYFRRYDEVSDSEYHLLSISGQCY